MTQNLVWGKISPLGQGSDTQVNYHRILSTEPTECLKAFGTVNIIPSTMGYDISTYSLKKLFSFLAMHIDIFNASFVYISHPEVQNDFFPPLHFNMAQIIFFLKWTALQRTFKSNNTSKNT